MPGDERRLCQVGDRHRRSSPGASLPDIRAMSASRRSIAVLALLVVAWIPGIPGLGLEDVVLMALGSLAA
jgi:hypothetical protein